MSQSSLPFRRSKLGILGLFIVALIASFTVPIEAYAGGAGPDIKPPGGGGGGKNGGNGGGKGSPNPPPPPKPKPPPPVSVNAGPDQTVDEGSRVTLSGSSNRVGARWRQTAGASVTLSSATALTPTFTAPNLTASQVLRFSFSYGSASDTVAITVRADNDPPSASAGPDRSVPEGAAVTLSGSGRDPEGGSLRYAWTQTGGSPAVALSGADRASAGFMAPAVTADTVLAFRLTVTDSGNRTATDTVSVTVTNQAPRVSDLSFTSRPASGDTYGLGERIRSRVAFDEIMTVSGSPALALGVGSRTRSMTHIGLGRGRVLDFEYQVQASDVDTNGISIGATALSLPAGASIANSAGEAASLGLSGHAITNDPSRKVDGSQGSGLPVGGTLPACTASDP